MRRPMARATSASGVGQTKILATSSHPGPATSRTFATSPGDSQFVIAASASAAASLIICGRSAASASAGGSAGGASSRNPVTRNVGYFSVTFSPASALRRNRSVSLARW